MRYFLPALIISLVAEAIATWWAWGRAPTDQLRTYYEGNFSAYATDRLGPWLVIFIVLWLVFYLFRRARAKRAARQNS